MKWYLETMSITKPNLQCAKGMNQQLLKTSGADVLSSRKKLRKTLWGVWGGGGGGVSISIDSWVQTFYKKS